MTESKYFQMREMIEQNAFRKKVPWFLMNTILILISVGILVFISIARGELGILTQRQVERVYLLDFVPFIVSASFIFIFKILPINYKKERQLSELLKIKKWSEKYQKEPDFEYSESLSEYLKEE